MVTSTAPARQTARAVAKYSVELCDERYALSRPQTCSVQGRSPLDDQGLQLPVGGNADSLARLALVHLQPRGRIVVRNSAVSLNALGHDGIRRLCFAAGCLPPDGALRGGWGRSLVARSSYAHRDRWCIAPRGQWGTPIPKWRQVVNKELLRCACHVLGRSVVARRPPRGCQRDGIAVSYFDLKSRRVDPRSDGPELRGWPQCPCCGRD
jgi:hypothetical protein